MYAYYCVLLKYKNIRTRIDKIKKKYIIELIHKYLLRKNKENDSKESNLIKFKSLSIIFSYLTDKGIANLGTIQPLQFIYLNARSL